MKIPFIKYSKLWFVIASLTVIASLFCVVKWGLKPGIDFTGGSLLDISFSTTRPTAEQLQQTFAVIGNKEATIQTSGSNEVIIRTNFLNEEQHQKILTELRNKYGANGNIVREESFQTIGATVSAQLRSRAFWAIVFVNLGIIIYMAYAFRKVSRPVKSWKYGVLAIVALVHDIILVLGIFALLGHFKGVEVDIAFVVALLTVLGYSVNDTIVVYDRIRENLLHKSSENFSEVVNIGLNETLFRSINTTLATLLPLFALYFIGGTTVHYFALALIIGMASGAYSSIFIAGPLLALVERRQHKA